MNKFKKRDKDLGQVGFLKTSILRPPDMFIQFSRPTNGHNQPPGMIDFQQLLLNRMEEMGPPIFSEKSGQVSENPAEDPTKAHQTGSNLIRRVECHPFFLLTSRSVRALEVFSRI